MSHMVRKQIYIEPLQEALLKRIAQKLEVSEAELIRQGIDRVLGRVQSGFLRPDPKAWEEAHQFMLDLHRRGPLAGAKRTWTRDDLYQDRLSRYEHDSD